MLRAVQPADTIVSHSCHIIMMMISIVLNNYIVKSISREMNINKKNRMIYTNYTFKNNNLSVKIIVQ